MLLPWSFYISFYQNKFLMRVRKFASCVFFVLFFFNFSFDFQFSVSRCHSTFQSSVKSQLPSREKSRETSGLLCSVICMHDLRGPCCFTCIQGHLPFKMLGQSPRHYTQTAIRDALNDYNDPLSSFESLWALIDGRLIKDAEFYSKTFELSKLGKMIMLIIIDKKNCIIGQLRNSGMFSKPSSVCFEEGIL